VLLTFMCFQSLSEQWSILDV